MASPGTLEYHGLIERDSVTQGYRIGHEILNMGAQASHEPLVRVARPALERYASELGETLMLAVPEGWIWSTSIRSIRPV